MTPAAKNILTALLALLLISLGMFVNSKLKKDCPEPSTIVINCDSIANQYRAQRDTIQLLNGSIQDYQFDKQMLLNQLDFQRKYYENKIFNQSDSATLHYFKGMAAKHGSPLPAHAGNRK